MNVIYALAVDPAELTHADGGPWCRVCGRRADVAPIRGGCPCGRDAVLPDGGWRPVMTIETTGDMP